MGGALQAHVAAAPMCCRADGRQQSVAQFLPGARARLTSMPWSHACRRYRLCGGLLPAWRAVNCSDCTSSIQESHQTVRLCSVPNQFQKGALARVAAVTPLLPYRRDGACGRVSPCSSAAGPAEHGCVCCGVGVCCAGCAATFRRPDVEPKETHRLTRSHSSLALLVDEEGRQLSLFCLCAGPPRPDLTAKRAQQLINLASKHNGR